MLGLFVEFFEVCSILGSPCYKSICTPTLDHCCSCAWARKLHIAGEFVKCILLNERPIGYQLLSDGDSCWPTLRRLALLQNGGGAFEYDESIRRAMTMPLGALPVAE